jgi:hypothetical protein
MLKLHVEIIKNVPDWFLPQLRLAVWKVHVTNQQGA